MCQTVAGAGEGGPEPAKEREARAPGKSQGRKGGGQRKQDLATAPSSPTRKQLLCSAPTPDPSGEPMPGQGGGRAFPTAAGWLLQRQGVGAEAK